MPALRVSAVSVDIPYNIADSHVMGVSRDEMTESESPLRVSAVVFDADCRICIISCDALGLDREICDKICESIESRCNITSANIMISATHTHHAPMSVSLLSIPRDEAYVGSLIDSAIEAASKAAAYLDSNPPANEADAELFFAVGNEATVGKNSRFILRDGGISWLDHKSDELIRPTGPMDPDLPVIVFKRPNGSIAASIFNHANHNIGFKEKAVSPGFYSLAARAEEEKHGGSFIFLPGAFGSTHPLDLSVDEKIIRVSAAINEAMNHMRLGLFGQVSSCKASFKYRVRRFDEVKEDAAVTDYCSRYLNSQTSEHFIDSFRDMRKQLASHQGEERESVIQVIRLGDIVIVGVPGELFTSLGLDIKHRSPFRYTIVTAITNDYIGYLPDMKGFADGGYQTWAGLQCIAEKGTGEAVVDAAIDLLNRAFEGTCESDPVIRDVRDGDADLLQSFYNSLDHGARVTFRPMGWTAALCDFESVIKGVCDGSRYDVVIEKDGRILGWAFIAGFDGEYPVFGIGVSLELRGKGYGRKIMGRVIDFGRRDRSNKGIDLTVVQTNDPARLLYESFGFKISGTLDGGDGLMYYSMRLTFELD